MAIKAFIRNRRLVVDAEFDLPEGTELHLVIDDGDDDRIDPIVAANVRAAYDAMGDDATPARAVLEELRSRRSG